VRLAACPPTASRGAPHIFPNPDPILNFHLPRDCDVCHQLLSLRDRLRYRKEGDVYFGHDTAGAWREFNVKALCPGCRARSRRNRTRSQRAAREG